MKRRTPLSRLSLPQLFLAGWAALLLFLMGIIGCSAMETNTKGQSKMDLETLVQKVNEAYPWTVEKIEKILGVTLRAENTEEDDPLFPDADDPVISYIARDVTLDDGFVFWFVEVRIAKENNEVLIVNLKLDKKSVCIPIERIQKMYPIFDDIEAPPPEPGGNTFYIVKQTWGGEIGFGFPNFNRECLSTIYFNSANF